jgi:hypothetical protein
LGQAFPPPAVPAFDFDLIVNAETGIFPGEELFDQLLADPFLAEQEPQDLAAKKAFELLYVYFRQNIKPAVGHKAAVGDQTVQVGVKIDQVAEGLDGHYHPGHGFFSIKGLLEKLFEGLIGALAELPQKLSIEPEIGPEHLGESKNILPVG